MVGLTHETLARKSKTKWRDFRISTFAHSDRSIDWMNVVNAFNSIQKRQMRKMANNLMAACTCKHSQCATFYDPFSTSNTHSYAFCHCCMLWLWLLLLMGAYNDYLNDVILISYSMIFIINWHSLNERERVCVCVVQFQCTQLIKTNLHMRLKKYPLFVWHCDMSWSVWVKLIQIENITHPQFKNKKIKPVHCWNASCKWFVLRLIIAILNQSSKCRYLCLGISKNWAQWPQWLHINIWTNIVLTVPSFSIFLKHR